MDRQEEDITRRVNDLVDTFVDRGECNFTEEFAELLPSSVFLGLMGLPEDELRMFLRLRDGILHPEKHDPDALFDPDARGAVMRRTGQEIYDYFGALVEERRSNPADDVVSRFLATEIDGQRLSRDEILDICFLFLIAGLDTVSDSLTCFYAFLATHPVHRRQIAEDPSCIPNAVEELLRWESPVPFGVPRVATEDTVLPGGHDIAKGTAVMVSYGGANVDPADCPEPFDVRFDRDANRHLAFGGGVHRCLGLPPRPARAPHHAAGVAPSHPGVRAQAGSRAARVPTRPAARQGPDARLVTGPRAASRRCGGCRRRARRASRCPPRRATG
jgi:cytochrome P450